MYTEPDIPNAKSSAKRRVAAISRLPADPSGWIGTRTIIRRPETLIHAHPSRILIPFARIPGDNGLESILLKPDVPAARLAKIDRKDTAGGALADQKGSAIRMHRASVHENRVRKFAPLSDRAVPLHSVDIPGPLAQRPGGYPKHTAGIKRKSHGRCWHLRKWGRRACRRIVAIDAIVRIDGDEYCTLSVDREILQERGASTSRL